MTITRRKRDARKKKRQKNSHGNNKRKLHRRAHTNCRGEETTQRGRGGAVRVMIGRIAYEGDECFGATAPVNKKQNFARAKIQDSLY